MAPWSPGTDPIGARYTPGADPSNLWGNAREGSAVSADLETLLKTPPSGAPPRALELAGVSRSYRRTDGEPVRALAGVTFGAAPHEVLAVVGPSGCGKSTLLELLCGLQEPDAGRLRCEPAVLMPQHDLLLPWLCALDNAALGLRIAGLRRAAARERAHAVFAELGLEGFAGARPAELSGGMRQRVAFARTLLAGKPVLCLDEPFGALDALTRAEMQDWLARALEREPRTVVLVTHDVEEAVVLADRVVVLSARPGRVVGDLDIPLERPRARTDADVIGLREAALSALAAGARL
jgi:NitT/TauT family transport system ATP-binding protein